jgi:acyl-CoA dehydrogenase
MIRDPESFTLLLDTLQRFVRDKLIPREAEVTETDEIPSDILAAMRELGLFGLTIPEEYGGLGLTTEEEVLTSMAVCYASPVFRSRFGTFALTEPDAGSDAGSVKTLAIREGDNYRVNGTKRYITNAPRAGMFTLMARTQPDVKGSARASPPSSFPPTRRASASASSTRRWARRAR